jgi:hypothetical protein
MRVLSLWTSTLSPSTVVVSYHPPSTSSFFRKELRCSMLVFSLTFVIPFRVRMSSSFYFSPGYWGGLCSSPWGDTLPALIGEVICAHRRGYLRSSARLPALIGEVTCAHRRGYLRSSARLSALIGEVTCAHRRGYLRSSARLPALIGEVTCAHRRGLDCFLSLMFLLPFRGVARGSFEHCCVCV